MENFGKVCFGVLAILLASIYGGFVFSKLWIWIIQQSFSVKSLSVYECIGIMFFIGSFIKTTQKEEDDESKTVWGKFIILILKCFIMYSLYLGIGYLYFVLR